MKREERSKNGDGGEESGKKWGKRVKLIDMIEVALSRFLVGFKEREFAGEGIHSG